MGVAARFVADLWRPSTWDPTWVTALAALGSALAAGALAWFAWRTAQLNRALVKSTADVARASRDEAEASRQLVEGGRSDRELAERALAAASRPVLVDVPIRLSNRLETPSVDVRSPYEGEMRVTVGLRNVGAGTALLTGIGITGRGVTWNGVLDQTVVPVGEATRIGFRIPLDRTNLGPLVDAIRADHDAVVEVGYTDVEGHQQPITRLFLRLQDGVGWYVYQCAVVESDTGRVIAMSGPSRVKPE